MNRLYNFVLGIKETELDSIIVKQGALKECFQDFNIIQNEIESFLLSSVDGTDVSASEITKGDVFESRYYETLALMNKMLNPPSPLSDLRSASSYILPNSRFPEYTVSSD